MADNIVLGAGSLQITLRDDAGDLKGDPIEVGETTAAALSIAPERLIIRASDGTDLDRRLVDIVVRQERTMTVTCLNMSDELVALFTGGIKNGAAAAAEIGAGEITETFQGAKVGGRYQLGTGAIKAGTARGPVLVLKKGADFVLHAAASISGGAKTVNDEYAVDIAHGIVHIIKSAALSAGAFTVKYTPSKARRLIRSDRLTTARAPVAAAVRYTEAAVVGTGRDIYIDRVHITPSGEWALKSREQPQQLQLSMDIVDGLWIDDITA